MACLACGGGRSALDLPSPVARTAETAIDFGLSDCGSTGTPVALTLTNDATALPLTWTATVDGPFALVGPTHGTLTSHEAFAITVVPQVPAAAAAGLPVSGTLHLQTNDPTHPVLSIPLTAITHGATLALPASVDFGDVPIGATSPPVPITVKNTGNAPVDLAFGAPANSVFLPIAPSVHAAPGTAAVTTYRFTPHVGHRDLIGHREGHWPRVRRAPVVAPVHRSRDQGRRAHEPGEPGFRARRLRDPDGREGRPHREPR